MRQDAKTRMQFAKLILLNLQNRNSDTWNDICQEICKSNNLKLDLQSPLFKHRGEIFPNLQRLNKARVKTAPKLHPHLLLEFEELHKKFVSDFRLFYGEFTNALAKFCRHATGTECFDEVFSNLILKPIHNQELIYQPAVYSKGWGQYTKQDFIEEYGHLIDQADFYLTARKLI